MMVTLKPKNQVTRKVVWLSDHADEEAEVDDLTFDEIFFSVSNGEIIEQYPTDKPYPSCLIYGQTFGGDHVHSV